MKENLQPLCLPRPFDVDAGGRIACRMAEVSTNACDCSAPGRSPATPADLATAQAYLEDLDACSNDGGGVACDSVCACELAQLDGDELDVCQSAAADPMTSHGFCYVGNDVPGANPALVDGCAETQKRRFRFMGEGVPAAGKLTMIVCDPE
jgi:hypothetical protein